MKKQEVLFDQAADEADREITGEDSGDSMETDPDKKKRQSDDMDDDDMKKESNDRSNQSSDTM